MMTRARWVLFAVGALIALLIAIHVTLTSLGSQGRSRSVEGLRQKVEQVLSQEPAPGEPGPVAPVAPAEPEAAKSEEAIAARWQRVFTLTRERFGDDPFYPEQNAEANSALMLPLKVRWGKKTYDALSAEELESLADLAQANQDLLSETLELTQSDMPVCQFLSYERDNRYWVLDSLLAAGVLLSAAQGHYDGAVRDLAAQARISLADPYLDYPFVTGSVTMDIIDDSLHQGAVAEELWDALLVELGRCRNHDLFVDGWAREAAATLKWYEDLPYSTPWSVTEEPWRHAEMWAYRYAGAPLLQHNEREFAEAMTELLDLTPFPYYEAKPELDRIRAEYGIEPPWELPPWRREPGSAIVSTLVTERLPGQAGVEADIDLTRMAILIERYRAQHGAYPDTLDAVAAGLGGAVPLNPFLGQPYHYERQGDAFVLSYQHVSAMGTATPDDDATYTRTWPAQWEPLEPTRE